MGGVSGLVRVGSHPLCPAHSGAIFVDPPLDISIPYDMNWPPGKEPNPEAEAANEVLTPAMRLMQLQSRHRALDTRIIEMQNYPYQNQILLQRLKKEKLRLKDSIARLKDEMIPDLDA